VLGPEFPTTFQPFLEGLSAAYYRIFESVLTEKPYPIRTVIAPGTQPTVSTRGTKNVIEALAKLDFFVIADVARTAELDYADIVIPLATGYESDHPFQLVPGWLSATRKVIEPLNSHKSIIEFMIDLGVTMGYEKDFWDGDVEAAMDEQLGPFDLGLEKLREQIHGVKLSAPPQKYEKYESTFSRRSPRLDRSPFLPQKKVALYNTAFEEAGFAPLPGYHEPPESLSGTPEISKKYPLILSDYHTSKNYSASWLRNIPNLREIESEPMLHIHPTEAEKRGIKSGDWIRVESPHGWMKVKAELYPGIRPDTVMLLHGWWQGCRELGIDDFPLADGGANVNNMYSVGPEAYDPLVTAMSSQTLVQVSKLEV
jgi:anaerobic selenocysteine-containing dehydrogenase